MKKYALFLMLPLCWACNDDELGFTDNPALQSVAGTWKVISFEDHLADERTYKTEENSRGLDIILTFDDSVTPHTIKGGNTTNSIWGTFENQRPKAIQIEALGSTNVGQPEWGDLFSSVISQGVGKYEINELQLRIYYNDEKNSVTLIKEN